MITDNERRILEVILDIPLKEGHPKHKIQKMFLEFSEYFPAVDVETADLYNDGDIISFHFSNDAFVVLCNVTKMTIESSILENYDDLDFKTFETIDFSWSSLAKRLSLFATLTNWEDLYSQEETIKLIKERLEKEL
jgi:hypothetical protein